MLLLAVLVATLTELPGGRISIGLRNTGAQEIAAYAFRYSYSAATVPPNTVSTVFIDPEVDSFAAVRTPASRKRAPLQPGQEYTFEPMLMVPRGRNATPPKLDPQVVTAGIYADGTAFGDPMLLNSIQVRRRNMLLAVDTALETLIDAGQRNIARAQLVNQFKSLAGALHRWYVPEEQQVARVVYQSYAGKLINLPEQPLGAPFPPASFIAQETATLNQQRVKLLAVISSAGK